MCEKIIIDAEMQVLDMCLCTVQTMALIAYVHDNCFGIPNFYRLMDNLSKTLETSIKTLKH